MALKRLYMRDAGVDVVVATERIFRCVEKRRIISASFFFKSVMYSFRYYASSKMQHNNNEKLKRQIITYTDESEE